MRALNLARPGVTWVTPDYTKTHMFGFVSSSVCSRPQQALRFARTAEAKHQHLIAERERSIFFRGYRYTLRDQDTTWPAAYESVRRGYDERGYYLQHGLQVWPLGCAVWLRI